MSAYYRYVVELAQRLSPGAAAPLKVLDYGCGGGKIVELALGQGCDAYGVDLYYEGGTNRKAAMASPLWGKRILRLAEDKYIPMQDNTFDAVLANQVFEHIDDFTTPLAEIHRVMKPGAVFINIFPSEGVWREGHVGVPFVHWIKPGSRARYYYALAWRAAGFGYHKKQLSLAEWTKHKLDWIAQWVFYKPRPAIEAAFGRHFDIEYYDADYIAWRIERLPRLRRLGPLLRSAPVFPVLGGLSARLAGHVFVLRKRDASAENPTRAG